MPEQQPSPAEFNAMIVQEFRTRGGRVGGMFEGAPLLLLTTTGARSGRPHTTPVVRLEHDGQLYVFASNAGGDRHPAWYHNLRADPRVTVEIGTGGEDGAAPGVETSAATAEPLEGEERDRVWAVQCALDPAFDAYQAGTSRTIPVVALHRVRLGDPERAQAIGEYLRRVHGELRADLAALRAQVEDHLGRGGAAAPALALPPRLAARCVTLCGALHTHHTAEDGAFGAFEEEFPQLGPALERLRREHAEVARSLGELEALLSGGDGVPAARVRDDLARLTAGLEAHFAYEESELLPVLGA